MADRGTATYVAPSAFDVVEDYDPIVRGGSDFEPVRFLNVGGVATPIG